MKTKRPASRPSAALRRSVDQDGVVRVELGQGGSPRWIWIFGLAAMVALAGLLVTTWVFRGPPQASAGYSSRGHEQAPRAPERGAPQSPQGAPPRLAERQAEAAGPTPHASIDEQEAPSAPEAAGGPEGWASEGQDRAEKERTGVAVFPAPGTKRIKPGIIVPDDFPLPPGYVRHFQATDKGRMLQAILMFHPDYKPQNADGSPIPLSEDRVVPPEMAPPGLPIEILEVPKDAYADTEEGDADTAP